MTFAADHFSCDAAAYAKFRPRYPDALFDFLANQAPAREEAGDARWPLAMRVGRI